MKVSIPCKMLSLTQAQPCTLQLCFDGACGEQGGKVMGGKGLGAAPAGSGHLLHEPSGTAEGITAHSPLLDTCPQESCF